MTQLYKKNGGVFIPISLTLEELIELKEELNKAKQELKRLLEIEE